MYLDAPLRFQYRNQQQLSSFNSSNQMMNSFSETNPKNLRPDSNHSVLPLSLTTVENFMDNPFTRSPRVKVSKFMTTKPRVININDSFQKNKDLDFNWDQDKVLKRD